MKRLSLSFLSREYQLETALSDAEIEQVQVIFREEIARAQSRSPQADSIDILVAVLADLLERHVADRGAIKKNEETMNTLRGRIKNVHQRVEHEIRKLTDSSS